MIWPNLMAGDIVAEEIHCAKAGMFDSLLPSCTVALQKYIVDGQVMWRSGGGCRCSSGDDGTPRFSVYLLTLLINKPCSDDVGDDMGEGVEDSQV